MWFDDLPPDASWATLWKGYIRCGHCSGIRTKQGVCPACQSPVPQNEPLTVRLPDGTKEQVSSLFMGGEGRYEDWVYLMMLEREWTRPLTEADRFLSITESKRPAARAVVVLVFWSYFETRIERLLREGMNRIPERMREDLLRRYSSVGSRLDRLYRVLCNILVGSQGLGFRADFDLIAAVTAAQKRICAWTTRSYRRRTCCGSRGESER